MFDDESTQLDQEYPDEFEKDMHELEKCANFNNINGKQVISCKLGLWEVSGNYGMPLFNEALYYFNQYKYDGEYFMYLGGPDPKAVLLGDVN